MSERIPIPGERLETVQALDARSETLFKHRNVLAQFLREYRQFIAIDPETQKRYTLQEMYAHMMGGSSLDDCIRMRGMEFTFEQMDLASLSDTELDKILRQEADQDEIKGAFADAMEHYQQLTALEHGETEESPDAPGVHYAMRVREYYGAQQTLEHMRQAESVHDGIIRKLLEKRPLTAAVIKAVEARRRTIQALHEQSQRFVHENPDAYAAQGLWQLREMKDAFDTDGKIVETPYVKQIIERMLAHAQDADPIFIHGELGAGKTEIARHVARTRLSTPHLARWEALHPEPPKQDADAHAAWAARRDKEAEALMVSGFRGIEIEAFIGAKAIMPGETPPPEEQLRLIRQGWESHREEVLKTAEQNGEDPGVFEKRMHDLYVKAYERSFERPIETRRIIGPMIKAMQEGRPIIIDEMNAIPHHVLIVLNDFLVKKPGDTILPLFSDMQPFEVQKGFCVIATGNYKPEDGVLYKGRQEVDAALLSRFGIIHYDYLPQSLERELPGMDAEHLREERQKNELFSMLITRLLHRNLSMQVPEGSVLKLQELARMARSIQNIMSGMETGEAWKAQKGTAKISPQEVLKENVLSIRHLLRILDRWQGDGYRYPLDVYVFQEYVARSSARPAEMHFLYQKLQILGDFFPTDNGWPSYSAKDQILRLNVDAIKQAQQEDALLAVYSPLDVVQMIYGPAPERTTLPAWYMETAEARPAEQALTAAEQLEYERFVAELSDISVSCNEGGHEGIEIL